MKRITACVVVGIAALTAGALSGCKTTEGTTLADGRVQRTGQLMSGIVAAGGETTGWALKTDKTASLELDVSKVQGQADRLKGKTVVVVGTMVDKAYPTRGTVQTLVAESIVQTDGQAPRAAELPPPAGPARK